MQASQELIDGLKSAAAIAAAIRYKIVYLLLLGLAASGYLFFSWYTPDSQWWWNAIKASFLFMPALVCVFFWMALGQLQAAPELVQTLIKQQPKNDTPESLHSDANLEKKGKLSELFGLLRQFREQDGVELIYDTISGVSLLINPLFIALLFICLVIVMMLIIVTVLLLIF